MTDKVLCLDEVFRLFVEQGCLRNSEIVALNFHTPFAKKPRDDLDPLASRVYFIAWWEHDVFT